VTGRPVLTLGRHAAPNQAKPPRPKKPPAQAEDVPRARFWFVWSPTEWRPHRRHATPESARAEAARLRTLGTGKEFLTYEATVVTDEAAPTNTDTAPDAAP
jgi:hypothetical protein